MIDEDYIEMVTNHALCIAKAAQKLPFEFDVALRLIQIADTSCYLGMVEEQLNTHLDKIGCCVADIASAIEKKQ